MNQKKPRRQIYNKQQLAKQSQQNRQINAPIRRKKMKKKTKKFRIFQSHKNIHLKVMKNTKKII